MHGIKKATKELRKTLDFWIDKNNIKKFSDSYLVFSNYELEICLIIYELLENLQIDSYCLVSSSGAGFNCIYLYKLSENQIVLVHSGINGIIQDVEEVDESFISNIRDTLDFFKINWKIFEENKKKIFENKIIHTDCYIRQIY